MRHPHPEILKRNSDEFHAHLLEEIRLSQEVGYSSKYYEKLAPLAACGLKSYETDFLDACHALSNDSLPRDEMHRLIGLMLSNNYDLGAPATIRTEEEDGEVDEFKDSPSAALIRQHTHDPASAPLDLLLKAFSNFPVPPDILEIGDLDSGDSALLHPIMILNKIISADEDSVKEKYTNFLKRYLYYLKKVYLSPHDKNQITAQLPGFTRVFENIDSYYPGQTLMLHYPAYLTDGINDGTPIEVKRAIASNISDLIKNSLHQHFNLDRDIWNARLGKDSDSRMPDELDDPFDLPIIDPIISRYCSDNNITKPHLKEMWQKVWANLPEGTDEKSKQLQLAHRSELQRDLIFTAQKIFCEYLETDPPFKALFEEIETKPFQELVQSPKLLNNFYFYGPTMEPNPLSEKASVEFLRDRSSGIMRAAGRPLAGRSAEIVTGAGGGGGGGGGL